MLKILLERFYQGHRTASYPKNDPVLPERFRGLPLIDCANCPDKCRDCSDICPSGALETRSGKAQIDLGLCLFCGACAGACHHGVVTFTREHSLASRDREGLVVGAEGHRGVAALDRRMKSLFGRSLKLRQVSAGGCNACEADLNVLSTLVYDMARFGIQFVASPRHADGLLVTGPVTENMKSALLETYEAVPAPKIVIASGACAIGGGPYRGAAEQKNGIGDLLPVDLYIPGCPPHPYTTLDALLRLLGRL